MNKDLTKTTIIAVLILIAAFSRIIPHAPNFTALGAVAIFSGFLISNRFLSLMIPLVSMWLSDMVINNLIYPSASIIWFTSGFAWIYAGILAHTVSAFLFKRPTTAGILGASLVGALLFFLLSNTGVWISSSMYEKTISGLVLCFTAAIPFFGNVLASNLLFSAVLFGIYFVLERNTRVFKMV